jgi:MFS family permease
MDAEAGRRRWAMLGVGMISMIAVCAFQYGLPFLVPAFRADGLSLTQAGALVSAPVVGVLSTLVVWGVVTDRVGERLVLSAGLAATAVVLGVASTVDATLPLAVLLAVAGATSACVHVASGRLILG